MQLVCRRLLIARRRYEPSLLQFSDDIKGMADVRSNRPFPVVQLVLNIDERMRLFFTTRDAGCDLETIRFHFEDLMFPWLTEGYRQHTICTSERFRSAYCFPEEQQRPDPTKKYSFCLSVR
jgi:hypothetical protein